MGNRSSLRLKKVLKCVHNSDVVHLVLEMEGRGYSRNRPWTSQWTSDGSWQGRSVSPEERPTYRGWVEWQWFLLWDGLPSSFKSDQPFPLISRKEKDSQKPREAGKQNLNNDLYLVQPRKPPKVPPTLGLIYLQLTIIFNQVETVLPFLLINSSWSERLILLFAFI